MIHVLIVDDHPAVGIGTKNMLEQNMHMKATYARSARVALEIIRKQAIQVVLCDLNMPGMNGIELSKLLYAYNQELKIIIYSGYELGSQFNALIESGVCGFIDKTSTSEELQDAIRCALRGDAVLPVQLLKQLRRQEVQINAKTEINPTISITEKEIEILTELATGCSNKELAEKFYISQRGIEYQITKIFDKLNVRTRAQAIKEAIRLDLIHDGKWRKSN